MNLCQHAKNEAISFGSSGDINDEKILQPDRMRTFWHISREQQIYRIWDMCRNKGNNIFSIHSENSVFGAFFGRILGKKSGGFLAPCQNFEIPRKLYQYQKMKKRAAFEKAT